MANTTINTTNATATATCPKTDIHSVNAMRAALINAHKACNRRAINADDCVEAGVPINKLDQWKDWTNKLRAIISDYVVAKSEKNHDVSEVTKLRCKIFPEWRKILKVGEEDKLARTMFVSEFDVDTLVGLCETWIPTKRGSAWSVKSATQFRKGVEAYLGCRMAANAVLTDDDRDVIRSYEGAESTIKTTDILLFGTTDQQGNHVNGIVDNLAKATKTVVKLRKNVAQFAAFKSASDEGDMRNFFDSQLADSNALLKEVEAEKERLEGEKAKAEKRIKKAKATIVELAEKYETAIGKIKEIEA